MGNDISLQFRLSDTSLVPATSNDSKKSPATMCQDRQIPSHVTYNEQVNSKAGVAEIADTITERGQCNLDYLQSEIETFPTTYPHADSMDKEGKDMQTKFAPSSCCDEESERKLKIIHQTLRSLDESLHETRGLESEKSFRYSQLKTKNMILQIDLDKAKKRNKNMLNLFRQNAAEIGFGRLMTSSTLPESLRKDIQRTWSQKYDALLEQNNQLKKEAADAGFALKNKDKEIADLQHRLLTLAEDLIEREKTIEKICTKFMSLKQRKDEQEFRLRGSVETLQNALEKVHDKTPIAQSKSESSMIPCKDAIIAREIRRGDRLAYENNRLKALLREAKRSCRSSRTSSTISLLYDKKM